MRGELSYIWMRKAWNWQAAELPYATYDLAMSVATFVIMLPLRKSRKLDTISLSQ